MPLQIPKQCRMGGHTIKIRFDSDLRSRGKLGECYRDQLRIHIADDVSPSQQAETYLHELVELASGIYDLDLSHQTIQTLGAALHQALTTGEA